MIYAGRKRTQVAGIAVAVYVLLGSLFILWGFHSKQLIQNEPLGLYIGGGIAVILVLALAILWPTATTVFLVAFTPVNRFVIMLVYHYSHSLTLTKGLELWKEAVLGAILIRVGYDFLFRPDRKHSFRLMDALVALFVVIGVIYLIYPGPLNTVLYTRVQGLRADTVFMLAYFAGRGVNLSRRAIKWIVLTIVAGSVLVGVVGVLQFAAPDAANSIFDQLGYSDFLASGGTIGDTVAVRSRDLPGADTLPRVGSLLLGDLALSFYQIFAVSLGAAIFFASRRMRTLVSSGLFLSLMVATLVMTVSRSAIASGIGAMFATALWARSMGRLVVLSVIGIGVVAAVLTSGFIHISTVEAMFTLDDASSLRHEAEFKISVAAIEAYPFGRGLGTAGNIGQQQVGSEGITNESWYLQIGTEMGVATMVLYVALVLMATVMGALQFLKVKDVWLRIITLTVAGTGGGMLVLGSTLHAWENTPLSMVFWLFAGIVWRSVELEKPDSHWKDDS